MNRDTILLVRVYYISFTVQFFEESFKREKLRNSKEVTSGLRVFD